VVRINPRAVSLSDQNQSGGTALKGFIAFFFAIAFLGPCSFAQAQTGSMAPNNTGINVRDRNPEAMTAGEQSNNKQDIELTRQIRRAVEKDDSLSSAAHNIKIISDGGIVVLRGPVKTPHEKQVIGEKAGAIAGANNVQNQLQVEQHQ
jgi:osmotically-inducible protein OsmY